VFLARSNNSKYLGRSTRSVSLRVALACIAMRLLLLPAPSLPQATVSAEYRSEANALSNFPNFVEWPAETFLSPQAPFLVCVYGSFSFGTVLSELTRAETVRGKRVDVRWVRKDKELRNCQILFVSRSEQKHYAKILAAMHGAPVLTVGETPDFNESGGIVEFQYEHDSLLFEVNLAAANEAHLKISSRFLSLARRIVNTTEAAKS
jgi:hypothetical protein